ncbi:MAG: GNAT family N-acetyltransferase [Bryobacteraceae bacterium]
MTIRSVRENDAARIADLNTQLGYPSLEAQVATRINMLAASAHDTILVAAAGDDQAVGWVHVRGFNSLHGDPIAEICGMVVDAGHRSHGVGTQLIAAAEEWARSRDFGSMRVRSNAIRKDAHRFYERVGFQLTKTSLTFQKRVDLSRL